MEGSQFLQSFHLSGITHPGKILDTFAQAFLQVLHQSHHTLLGSSREIIVGQPASLKAAADILDTLPIEQQSLYLQWKLIDSAASLLNDAMAEQNFDFYSRTMSGTQEMQPRWKRAVSTVSSALGEAVGQMYVEKYFPAAVQWAAYPEYRQQLSVKRAGLR